MIDDVWKLDGTCAGHEHPEWWHSPHDEQRLDAVAICRGCPVRSECAAHAIDSGQEHGIWGGLMFHGTKRPHRVIDPNPTVEKDCVGCGKRFVPPHPNRMYCSNPCQYATKRRRFYTPRVAAPPCGTDAAYQRHKKLREQVCGPCADAHRTDQLDRRARQRTARNLRDIHNTVTKLNNRAVAS